MDAPNTIATIFPDDLTSEVSKTSEVLHPAIEFFAQPALTLHWLTMHEPYG